MAHTDLDVKFQHIIYILMIEDDDDAGDLSLSLSSTYSQLAIVGIRKREKAKNTMIRKHKALLMPLLFPYFSIIGRNIPS